MCGIVGYAGKRSGKQENDVYDVIINGLKRLEYRGYDSAGIALVSDGGIVYDKKAGKLVNLISSVAARPLPIAVVGIGHTRWATHGAPTDVNAHPHIVGDGKVAVVHNGIIENFSELKQELSAQGHKFVSDTDTEVAGALLADTLKKLDGPGATLKEAMRRTAKRLKGAFTLLAVCADFPDTVVAARHNSPLVVGLGEGEKFLSSDVSGFIDFTKEAIEVSDQEIVTITPESVEIIDFDNRPSEGKRFVIDWDAAQSEKEGYDSFMMKEIEEQPVAVADTLRGRIGPDGCIILDELRIERDVLRTIDKVIVVACGTAAYVGGVAKYALEQWCRIPVEVELAHEFRYRDPIVTKKTLVIAVSQSGETMDTLMAVRHAQEKGARVVAICNTNGATIPRQADAVLYTHAGPEIAVASTKAFSAQIVAIYLLGLCLSQLRGDKDDDEIMAVFKQLQEVPERIREVLECAPEVEELAHGMKDIDSMLLLGRHIGYPVALEGALKLKEISYVYAEGFAAGELKHGPIALVEPGRKVFVIVPSLLSMTSLHGKVMSNIQEIRARGAEVVAIAEAGDDIVSRYATHVIKVPQVPNLLAPLVTIVPLQFLAVYLATAKGHNVDQPRNLAKSVTVE